MISRQGQTMQAWWTLAFTLREVGSHWGGRTGKLGSVLKAYIYSYKPSVQMVKPRLREVVKDYFLSRKKGQKQDLKLDFLAP